MAKKKRVDPIKQREKRAKIAAAIGGILFLAVAAYEVPGILKAFNPKPPPVAHSATTTTSAAGTAGVPGSAEAPVAPAAGELADTDVAPVSAAGQLVSFSVFETKNPFRPQVTVGSPTSAASSSAPSAANKPSAAVSPSTTTPGATTPTATTPAPAVGTPTTSLVPPAGTAPTTTTTPTAAPPPVVAISVNGKVSHVASEGTFPTGSPVFRLVSYDASSAEIGIVGGSYATGDTTLTLHLNRPVTLQNQNDGKRYTLVLVKTG